MPKTDLERFWAVFKTISNRFGSFLEPFFFFGVSVFVVFAAVVTVIIVAAVSSFSLPSFFLATGGAGSRIGDFCNSGRQKLFWRHKLLLTSKTFFWRQHMILTSRHSSNLSFSRMKVASKHFFDVKFFFDVKKLFWRQKTFFDVKRFFWHQKTF